MTLCCDDEEDPDVSKQLEEALAEQQEGIAEEFRTDYKGDYEDLINERRELRYNNLTPWDQLLPTKDRTAIAKLNIELHTTCPHLQKAIGSESFYYCHALAYDIDKRPDQIGFASEPGQIASAENLSKLPPSEISEYCIEKFSTCNFKKEHDEVMKD